MNNNIDDSQIMQIKAIETAYKGHLFRSRLEARWAVFLDALGVPWEYEKEGYQLPSGWYLPDFYLPHLKAWMEIKGVYPTDLERKLARDLYLSSGEPVYVFIGQLHLPVDDYPYVNDVWMYGDYFDTDHCWCECPQCGAFGIQYEGRTDRMECKRLGTCSRSSSNDRGINIASPRLLKAYTAAISARFEHNKLRK